MPKLNLTTAFARYGAKLANPQWAVSAMSKDGELVISCWAHKFSWQKESRSSIYTDRHSRISHNKLGADLLRNHLDEALAGNVIIRLVRARLENPEDEKLLEEGVDASTLKKTFSAPTEFKGSVVKWDGDNFEIEFKKF